MTRSQGNAPQVTAEMVEEARQDWQRAKRNGLPAMGFFRRYEDMKAAFDGQ